MISTAGFSFLLEVKTKVKRECGFIYFLWVRKLRVVPVLSLSLSLFLSLSLSLSLFRSVLQDVHSLVGAQFFFYFSHAISSTCCAVIHWGVIGTYLWHAYLLITYEYFSSFVQRSIYYRVQLSCGDFHDCLGTLLNVLFFHPRPHFFSDPDREPGIGLLMLIRYRYFLA